jgi:hypothetical protein
MLSPREPSSDQEVGMSERELTSTAHKADSTKHPRREYRHDRYTLVCGMILLTILSMSLLGDGVWGLLVTLVFMTGTLVVTLRTSNAGNRALLIGTGVSAVAMAGIAIAVLTGNIEVAKIAYGCAMLGLVGVTPIVIARRLASHTVVNRGTVTGAAAIYLLLGLFFSVVYTFIGAVMAFTSGAGESGVFFTASRPIVPSDFVYYSFTTLTTVGYGDLTASIASGRMLSVCEALIGQLYLVTVVAVLVANIGRNRRTESGGPVGLLREGGQD